MARYDLDLSNKQKTGELVDPAAGLIQVGRTLRIRQLGVGGVWDPQGTYTTAEMQLVTWNPQGLDSLSGFCALVEEDEDVGNLVRFRLSSDGGTTPLWFDAGTWSTATLDSEWNTELEIDSGINLFPFLDSLTILIRMESGDGSSTPVFSSLHVFWEPRYNVTEDVFRSLKQKILTEVDVLTETCVILEEPKTVLKLEDALWQVNEPIQVYNLTDDPTKTTNLFASKSGDLLTLSAAQEGELLIRYRASPKPSQIHVISDADYQAEELPAVVMENPAQNRVRDFLLANFEEPLRSLGVVRLRPVVARWHYDFQIHCMASDALRDKVLSDAVMRIFNTNEFVRSLAADEEMVIVSRELITQLDDVFEQRFERQINITISVWENAPEFTDVPMVTTIAPSIGTQIGILGDETFTVTP